MTYHEQPTPEEVLRRGRLAQQQLEDFLNGPEYQTPPIGRISVTHQSPPQEPAYPSRRWFVFVGVPVTAAIAGAGLHIALTGGSSEALVGQATLVPGSTPGPDQGGAAPPNTDSGDRPSPPPEPTSVGERKRERQFWATQLEEYNLGSEKIDSVADGQVTYYRREVSEGMLHYMVVYLGGKAEVDVMTADGKTPETADNGDTGWIDNKPHLQTLVDMFHASHSDRKGKTKIGAINLRFFGERTPGEGALRIHGVTLHINSDRPALAITHDGHAAIGKFTEEEMRHYDLVVGLGPPILQKGQVAGKDMPLDTSGFALGDWRREVYEGTYNHTNIGIGKTDNGGSFLVLSVATGVKGLDIAGALKALGCSDAISGDDDSSTQAVWRGTPVVGSRAIPDGLGIYIEE